MNRELADLLQALREIAFDAGCVLLCRVDPEAAQRCAARYNGVRGRLCTLHPAVASFSTPLPLDASPGNVRIAARSTAAFLVDTLASSCTTRIAA